MSVNTEWVTQEKLEKDELDKYEENQEKDIPET